MGGHATQPRLFRAHKVRVRTAAVLTGGKESEHIGKFMVVLHAGFSLLKVT